MSMITPDWSREVDQRLESMVTLRRDFHRHPELSFEEHRTAEIIAERLHAANLDVRTGLGGTGVVGVLHGDKPVTLHGDVQIELERPGLAVLERVRALDGVALRLAWKPDALDAVIDIIVAAARRQESEDAEEGAEAACHACDGHDTQTGRARRKTRSQFPPRICSMASSA